MTPDQFKTQAKEKYGEQAEAYLELFPADNQAEVDETRSVLSEMMFGYQNFTWAKIQSDLAAGSSYLYHFTRVPPGEPNYGAFHSAESSYAFHTLKYWDRPFTETDYKLEEVTSEYWVNFVKTGNPNGEGLPNWPAFDSNNPMLIELGNNIGAIEPPHLKQIQFLQSIYLK
jgi:para-nitrobenzyl esterase